MALVFGGCRFKADTSASILVLDAKLAVSTRCMMLLRPNEWAMDRRVCDEGGVIVEGEAFLRGLGVIGVDALDAGPAPTATRITRRTLLRHMGHCRSAIWLKQS